MIRTYRKTALVQAIQKKPAPTRPEAAQEAMENVDIIAKMPIGERDSLDDNLVDLAAYARELEAERDRLKAELEKAGRG